MLIVKILNRTNGRYPDSQVYWSFNGTVRSIAQQQYLDMPANSAGRMYFYLGSPTSAYFDFIEFTVGPAVFNGNTSRVDAFGLKLALRLHARDGYDAQVGEDQATFAGDRAITFQRFRDAVPAEFDVLTKTDQRIVAPSTGSPTASRTTTRRTSRPSCRTATRSGCWSPSAGDRGVGDPGRGRETGRRPG